MRSKEPVVRIQENDDNKLKKETGNYELYSGKRLSEIQTKPCLAWFIARDTVPHTTAHRYIAAYLEAALEDGNPSLVVAALGDIARGTGLGRESLYKSLSNQGNR